VNNTNIGVRASLVLLLTTNYSLFTIH